MCRVRQMEAHSRVKIGLAECKNTFKHDCKYLSYKWNMLKANTIFPHVVIFNWNPCIQWIWQFKNIPFTSSTTHLSFNWTAAQYNYYFQFDPLSGKCLSSSTVYYTDPPPSLQCPFHFLIVVHILIRLHNVGLLTNPH